MTRICQMDQLFFFWCFTNAQRSRLSREIHLQILLIDLIINNLKKQLFQSLISRLWLTIVCRDVTNCQEGVKYVRLHGDRFTSCFATAGAKPDTCWLIINYSVMTYLSPDWLISKTFSPCQRRRREHTCTGLTLRTYVFPIRQHGVPESISIHTVHTVQNRFILIWFSSTDD